MWRSITWVGLPRRRLGDLSRRLFALGAAGLQEDHLPGEAPPPRQPWDTGPPAPPSIHLVLTAWFEDPDEPALQEALRDVDPPGSWADVEEVDWETAWRERFPPVRVSETLTIAPPWDAPPGALIIEPGQGFGTGHHESTRQALQLLERVATAGERALDIGCGSGVLALAAARLGMLAHGVDVEPEAVRDAQKNAERNRLDACFDTTPVHDLALGAPLVLANLHAELLVELAEPITRLATRTLIVAGVLEDREALVLNAYPALQVAERLVDGPWVALRFERP